VIYGGEVLDNVSRGNGSEYDVLGTDAMQIYGGSFTQDVGRWLAEGVGLVFDHASGKYLTTEAVYEYGGNTYGTLEGVIEAIRADSPDSVPTVRVIADHRITTPIVIDVDLVLDLGGRSITSITYPAIRVQGGAEVTLVGDGNIRGNDYLFVLGAQDGSSAGYLTIESGNYRGVVTVASVTKGALTVNGGTFRIDTDTAYNYQYLLNCIDASYRDGTARIAVNGGVFYGFNPASNAAEGQGTDFLASGYVTYDSESDCYTVHPEIRFRSSNLLLGNTIGIYFNLDTADLVDGLNYVAVFTIHGTEYRVPRYDADGNSNWVIRNSTPDVTRILFEGIAAKEMTLEITVTLTLDGRVVSNTVSDSVKSYVERGIASGVFTAEDMDLVIQMINYGALAQQSFDYRTDDLANSGEHASALLGEYARPDGEYTNGLDATQYYGASLNLENNIGFNFKFYAEGIEGATRAVITYVNHTGRAFEIEVSVDQFVGEVKNEREITVIHVGTLVAADARQMITCRILDSEGNVLAYAKDSIESYCARAIAGLGEMPTDVYGSQSFKVEFYQALMKYSMAAYDYDVYTKK
jgi:hypothetical protein